MKAVIFDLNGVFIQSPKLSERFKETYGVATADFLATLKTIMAKARLPKAGRSFEMWRAHFIRWGVKFSEEEFFKFWFSAEKEIPEMITLARELKNQGVKIFILSNNFQERAVYYSANFRFLRDIPEKVYYSWQTGFVKPDKRAYELITRENNLDARHTLYFDDSQENIKVATGLGIKSYSFKDRDTTEEIIDEAFFPDKVKSH